MKLAKAVLENLSKAGTNLGGVRDLLQTAADIGQTDFDEMSEKRQESPSGLWLQSKIEEIEEVMGAVDDLLNDIEKLQEEA